MALSKRYGVDIFGIDNSIPVVGKDDIFGYKANITRSPTEFYTQEEIESFKRYDENKALEKAAEVQPDIPLVQRKDAFSIDALLKNGKEFYSVKINNKGHCIGLAVALQKAIDEVGLEGIATMPYLIAGISKADENNYLRQRWHTAHSEEYAGIDKNGKLAKKGQAVVIVMHGGGILTPDRILMECNRTYVANAKLSDQEFDGLLNGILPSGETINLYRVEDVKKGVSNPFGRDAVWVEMEKLKPSGFLSKKYFLSDELVIARAGTLDYLDAYFNKIQDSSTHIVGNWHSYGPNIDFRQPLGRALFVSNNYNGLNGYDDLNDNGRFVGVAPEAQGAKIP